MNPSKKILIMAGGTGGHIFPGIAIGRAIQQKLNSASILWLGSKGGMETQIIPAQTNFKLFILNIQGFRKKSLLKKLILPFYLIFAIYQAIKIFKKEKPDIVIGMGGFVCAPGGIAARLLNIPLYVHEQNSISGMTNKMLSRFAQKVFTGFPTVLKLSNKKSQNKIIFTGNPVREEILNIPAKTQIHTPVRLFIMGGSRGAQIFNEILPKAIALMPTNIPMEIIHQTGKSLSADYSQLNNNFISVKSECFIQDMAALYNWADIIICRSGALTLAEITAVGIPAILIPYPFAVDDHQTVNAKYLSDNHAAILLNQKNLTPTLLLENLLKIIQPENFSVMACASRALRSEDSIDKILAQLIDHTTETTLSPDD